MGRFRNVFIILIIFILLIGCSNDNKSAQNNQNPKSNSNVRKSAKLDHKKPMSWGHRQTIYIFADDPVWKYAEKQIRKNLERDYFTTENETYFDIKRVKFEQLDQFYRFNNLIFFCDLSSDRPVAEYVKSIMGETVSKDVQENFGEIYPQHNLWANDQLTIFMVGKNEESLLRMNILQSEEIFQEFKIKLAERINRRIYMVGILPLSGFNGLPWEIEVPKNYMVFKDDRENNFLSFLARGHEKPDRYVSIYYTKMDSNLVTRNWLKETRADLAWNYYDEDEFKESDIKTEFFTLADIKGWRLSGRWQNMKYAVGGAFQSYAFYDESSGIAYLVDNSVYFPEGYKIAALVELEEISKSLRLK